MNNLTFFLHYFLKIKVSINI